VQDQIRWADRVSLVLGARRDHARSKTEGQPSQTDNATTYRAGLIGELGAGRRPT
jgi:iron complex outermembrane receptor protein